MYIRKIISIVICMCFFATTFISVSATDNDSTQKRAVILNQLNIIAGDGKGNYDLGSELKRREAATFITKVMGKADYVINNAQGLKYTNFTDVKETDWFAPYVGFCEQNKIVSGYPDGRFGHNDSINEKAFLTMLIRAMGYNTDEDFSYNDVHAFAHQLGLLNDIEYKERANSNDKYIRGYVVDVLYNAMTKKIKGQEYTLVQKLVQDGAISKSIALNSGLLVDSVIAGVSEINSNNETQITIKLNETVKPLKDINFILYETKNKINKLSVALVSQNNQEIVLKTAKQAPEMEYTLEIVNSEDLENNINDVISVNFKGYKFTEIKSDFFKISKIDVISKNTINVYFTHPINVNGEYPAYYDILEDGVVFASGLSQDISAKLISTANNGISLSLKDKIFIEGKEYTLNVSGDLTSLYTVNLGVGSGDSMNFYGKGNDNQTFSLINSIALNNRTVQLIFNKELNPNLAQQKLNYIITTDDANKSPVAVSSVELVNEGIYKGQCVKIYLNGYLDKNKLYNLKIDYMTDISRQDSIIDKEYKFSGSYSEGTNIKVEGVIPLDAGTVVVYFDRGVDKLSAAIPSNFLIYGVSDGNYFSVPAVTYFDKERPNLVKLFLPTDKFLQAGKVYKLKVQVSLMDAEGHNLSTPIESSFAGLDIATAKPAINTATIISNDTIKLTFTKEIALNVSNISPSNYVLEYEQKDVKYTKVPLSVNYIDATTVSLRFDKLELATSYRIRFKTITDYSGLNTATDKDTDTSAEVIMGQ